MLVQLVEDSIAEREQAKAKIEAELEALQEIKAIATARLNGGAKSETAQASRPAAARKTQPRARKTAADPPKRSRASRPARKTSARRRPAPSTGRPATPAQPEEPRTDGAPASGEAKQDTRVAILQLLELRGEMAQGAISDAVGRNAGTVSVACKELERSGKITRRRDGKSVICRLPDAHDRENGGGPGVADAEQLVDQVKDDIVRILREEGDGRQGLDIYELLDPKPTDHAFGVAIAQLQKEGKLQRSPRAGRMVFVLTAAAR